MLPRWQGGVATIVAIALAVALVVLDLTDRGVRRFWTDHTLTADYVAGVLVLALTVLVVNQLLSRQQLTERARAVAAQAGILLAQARRSVKAVVAARDSGGDRTAASDELRTYFLMLLVSAPVLIEDPVARRFLEQAQGLAAEMARVLSPSDVTAIVGDGPEGGLEEAVESLRDAVAPLLAVLKGDERSAMTDLSS